MDQGNAETESAVWKRFLPLGVIVAALALFFGFGLQRYFTLDSLAANQAAIKDFAVANRGLTMLAIIAVYAAVTAISFPGAAVMTLLAGFILGTLYGGIAVVIGATIGATLIFLAGRSAAGDVLARRGGETVKKLEAGFTKDATSYLFILRLVPVFPFWLVNLAAAAFRVPTRIYVLATFFGIMPGTFVYASVGAGFGSIAESSSVGLDVLLKPAVILPILGLAGLSLLPVIFKKTLRRKQEPSA